MGSLADGRVESDFKKRMTHFAIPRFFSLWIDLRGQDLIEYALLAAMVAAMAVALFPAIDSTSRLLSHAISALSVALSTTAGIG